jgi:hypothetical protein
MTTKPTGLKAVLIMNKNATDLLKRKVERFRAIASLKGRTEYAKGIGSYALYGIKESVGQFVVLASEPTSADFNKYVTAKAKADFVSEYDQVIEYRDAGTANSPKVTFLCWTQEKPDAAK